MLLIGLAAGSLFGLIVAGIVALAEWERGYRRGRADRDAWVESHPRRSRYEWTSRPWTG